MGCKASSPPEPPPSPNAKGKFRRQFTLEDTTDGDQPTAAGNTTNPSRQGSPSEDHGGFGADHTPSAPSSPKEHVAKGGLRRSCTLNSLGSEKSATSGGSTIGSHGDALHIEIISLATRKCVQANSLRGKKSKEGPNQDTWCAVTSPIPGYNLYGVFDGHGKNGHHVSAFVRDRLPKHIFLDERLTFGAKQLPAVMKDAFEKMTEQIHRASCLGSLNALKSGTTATIVLHDVKAHMLTISHVGDSGAAIAKGTAGKAQYMTPDHKPNLPGEKKRIQKAGGTVHFDGYGYRVRKMGVSGPELNMSRCFGDLDCRQLGIISEPETTQFKLSKSDQFLVLCSDGVWEFLPVKEAISVVKEALHSNSNGARALAKQASDCWEENSPDGQVDDITAVIVLLQVEAEEEQQPAGPKKPTFKSALKRCDSNVSMLSAGSGSWASTNVESELGRGDHDHPALPDVGHRGPQEHTPVHHALSGIGEHTPKSVFSSTSEQRHAPVRDRQEPPESGEAVKTANTNERGRADSADANRTGVCSNSKKANLTADALKQHTVSRHNGGTSNAGFPSDSYSHLDFDVVSFQHRAPKLMQSVPKRSAKDYLMS